MTKRREPKQRRKQKTWTVDDARWFLESTWHAREALYAAFVLVLVLGLRKGEVLGLAWDQVDLDAGELYVGEQLQRVRHQLVRREVKTETSEAPLPLPDLCVAALRIRQKLQDADRDRAGDGWIDTGLVFSTRHGTPIVPRNFNRSFDRCIVAAQVPGFPSTASARPVPRCWPLSMSIRVWRCASCGIARSPSRWRSIPKHRPTLRAMPSASSATGSHEPLLPFAAARRSKKAGPRSEPASGLGGRYWDRTSDLLLTMETLCRLS